MFSLGVGRRLAVETGAVTTGVGDVAVEVVHGSLLEGKALGDRRSAAYSAGDDTVTSGFIPLTGPDLVRFPDLKLPETVSGLLSVEALLSAFV